MQLFTRTDYMKTNLPGREPLNGAAESGLDLLEIDVFDGTKSVRTKNRCNAGRLETTLRAGSGALPHHDPCHRYVQHLSSCSNRVPRPLEAVNRLDFNFAGWLFCEDGPVLVVPLLNL